MSFYSIDQFIRENYPQYWGYESYPQEQCVCIRKVSDEWGIFSNFASTPLVVGGEEFKSSEELFQLMKFKDGEILNRIRRNITREGKVCYQIKKTVKSYEKEHRRDDWGTMVIDAMKFCLQTKYEQSEEFRRKLESTRGLYIVEDQTSLPKRNPDAWGVKPCGTGFSGPNLLGRLLMELRDNGSLSYTLPPDALDLLDILKQR